jgi:2-oxoglutarate ferredoxin oxidoreductase subunit beta
MTGGQVSGTTPEWAVTSTTAFGNPEREFDICALAETAGANYVARCTPDQGWEMKEIMKQALSKKGFSLVEVVSPCPTHYGRNNEMKEISAMLHWLAARAMPVERYRMLAQAERGDRFPVGTLVDRNEPDFNTRYDTIRARARQA